MDNEFVIKNGYVVDGSGNPWFKADIAVRRGKIVEVGAIRSTGLQKSMTPRGASPLRDSSIFTPIRLSPLSQSEG